MFNVRSRLFLCIAAATMIGGCASSGTVYVRVMRPARLDITQYRRVYVDEFRNQTFAANVHDHIAFAVEDGLHALNRFDVIDKSVFDVVQREHRGSVDDLVVVAGTVSTFRATQELSPSEEYWDRSDRREEGDHDRDKSKNADKGKDGDKPNDKDHHDDRDKPHHVEFTRTARVKCTVQFKIIRASDAKVVAVKEITREVQDSRTATDQPPRRFDLDELSRVAEKQVVAEFLDQLVPQTVTVAAAFALDGDIPQLEQGLDDARRGDWDQAISAFQTAATRSASLKPDQRAKAFYDLGLALEFTNRFDDANVAFNRAITLDPQTYRYSRALAECNDRRRDYRELQAQGWD